MRLIHPLDIDKLSIFREDTNLLAKKIKTDIVYIDPPYNSRQYSRFYHILETLTKWDNPKLYGVALKPELENMSDYCRESAKSRFSELVNDINTKHLVVSYNNTYTSKSNFLLTPYILWTKMTKTSKRRRAIKKRGFKDEKIQGFGKGGDFKRGGKRGKCEFSI